MKPNKLTAGANVMWESSRMMLPEHKERSIQQLREEPKRMKPELTEEEQEELFGRLKTAKANTLKIKITVFGELENRQVVGIVTGLDPRLQLIKVESKGDWQLIEFKDVVGVELDAYGY